MNLKYLTYVLAFCFSTSLFSQKIAHAFKWEAATIDGGSYIGISPSRKQALIHIEKLTLGKKGSKSIVDYEIRFSPIEEQDNINIYEEFLTYGKNKNPYVYLSGSEIEAIHINREWGRYNSIEYFKENNAIKKIKSAEKHLVSHVFVYEKFLFLSKNKKSKEIYLTQTSAH